MLTLYRHADCPSCEEVALELQELRLAHRVLTVPDGALGHREAESSGAPAGAVPPILADGDVVCVGREAIAKHLAEVARLKDRWQQHGADACYCDPDGGIL